MRTMVENVDYEAALKEATRLASLSDEQLFEELGLRLQDVVHRGGYERAKQYSGQFKHAATDLAFTDDLKAFGKKWWANMEPDLLQFVCSKDDAERAKLTQGKT
ncbi:MAG: hypothetical protein WA672_02900, partial [Candidatus Angelobacter sp.]